MDISLSDILSFLAIVISIYTSTVLVKSRAQKDFLIEECRDLKDEYRDFVISMRRGELNAESIRDELKYFSLRIIGLQDLLKKEYANFPSDLVTAHSDFQWEITMLQSLENNYGAENTVFSNAEKTRIMDKHENVDKCFISTVVALNRASQIAPWDRSEENLGF